MPDGQGPHSFHRRRTHPARWLVLVVALAAISFAFMLLASALIPATGARLPSASEKACIDLALQTKPDLHPDFNRGVTEPLKDWFPHRTDGVINPLWPWLAAWLVEDATPAASNEVKISHDQEPRLLVRGQWFNVGWALGILMVLGLACTRMFTLGSSLNMVLLAAFGALLPATVHFRPEVVYSVFFLATWVACLFALHKNSLWMHSLIGVFGGLAYLADEAVVPLIAVYLIISTVRWAWGWIEAWWPSSRGSTTLWLRRNHFIALFLMSFCFLMTAGPRLSYSARTFGNPFHSYPAAWMWLDTPAERDEWTSQHPTKEALESVPPEQRPNPKHYVATHTREQMLDRLLTGGRQQVVRLLWPAAEGVQGLAAWRGVALGWLLLALGGVALLVLFGTPKPVDAAQRLHPETVVKLVFVLGSIACYLAVYGWYAPMDPDNQRILSLYPPLVLSIVWAGESMTRRARRRGPCKWLVRYHHLTQWALVAAVAWQLFELLPWPLKLPK